MSTPFPGSPRPSSGYCSDDDELTTRVPSDRPSDSTSVPSGSCPVTPDSASSEVSFSTSGLFEDDLGLDSGFLLSLGCDVSWLRSPTSLPDDLGLDLGSEIPDGPDVVARSRTSSFGVSGSLTSAVFETGNGDDLTGSGRRSNRRHFPLPVSSRCQGDEEEDAPDARCQRIPISVKVADSSSPHDDSVVARRAQLPSNRGSHGNAAAGATRTLRVGMTTSKRTICRCASDGVTDDVIDDVTVTPRHVLSDHGYSTTSSPSLFPPVKQPRLSLSSGFPPGAAMVREASVLAALLLTKEPLRANAGSDALLALDRRTGPTAGPSSVLEGLLLTDRRSSAAAAGDDAVRTADSVSGWKTSFSGLTEEEGYVLDSDHLLRDKDGLHVGLTSAEDDLAWTTPSQVG